MSDEDRLGLSDLQVATIDAIVGAFECARPFYYSRTARASGDAGGFSYGTHQVSHTSGNLHALLCSYCEWQDPPPDPDFSARVKKRLKDVAVREKPKNGDVSKWKAEVEAQRKALLKDDELKNLVELAAQDKAMRKAQDAFFFTRYMKPAIKQARSLGFTRALSVAVFFDSAIHSGPGWFDNNKDDVDRLVGAPANAAIEEKWVEAYVRYRRAWLEKRAADDPEKYGILLKTLYRADTFLELIRAGNWDLVLPVKAHSYTITPWDDFAEEYFNDPVNRADAALFGEVGPSSRYDGRALFVQRSLKLLGYLPPAATADGVYGGQTRAAVEAFQQDFKLEKTGKVGGATYERLCTQVSLKLSEQPDAAGGTPDGLRPMADPPKGSTPVLSGAGAVTAGAATVGAGVMVSSDETASAPESAAATAPAASEGVAEEPVPVAAESVAPEATGSETGAPLTLAPVAKTGWQDPWVSVLIAVGFVATIILASWFFRRNSQT